MSLFKKNANTEAASAQDTAYAKKNRASSTLMLRVIAGGYVLYMLYNIINSYMAGGEDAPSLTVLILSILVLGGGGVAVLIMAWREYQRNKREAEEMEAAAKLQEEEAAEEQETLPEAEEETADTPQDR